MLAPKVGPMGLSPKKVPRPGGDRTGGPNVFHGRVFFDKNFVVLAVSRIYLQIWTHCCSIVLALSGRIACEVGDDIVKASMPWKGIRVLVKLTVQNRQAKVCASTTSEQAATPYSRTLTGPPCFQRESSPLHA